MEPTYNREAVERVARFVTRLAGEFDPDFVDVTLARHFDAVVNGERDPDKLAEAVAGEADPRWRRDSFSSRLTRSARDGGDAGTVLTDALKRFREERQGRHNPLQGS